MGAIGPEPKDLFCPSCGLRHIDEGEWATKPHKTHRCVSYQGARSAGCGHDWRPFDFATVGRASRTPWAPNPNEVTP